MKNILVYGMTDNPGGIEAYLLNLFLRVQGKDIQMDFISDFPSVAHSDKLKEGGANIYFFSAKSRSLWRHWKQLWKVLAEHKEYKTIYFNVLDAGAAVTMAIPFLMGRKIVVHSHNGDTDKKRLHRICRPFLKIMTSSRVACSKKAAEHMFGEVRNVLIIPNAIDAARYQYKPEIRVEKRLELDIADKWALCHVGRLSNQKNPFGLIDIFEEVYKREPNAVLLSIGSGELEEEFVKYIRNKNLQKAVICLGVRKDVPEILQATDVFLLPSFYEGLSIAALEAQAAGLPCVVSDGVSEETDITDRMYRISLKESVDVWAEQILSVKDCSREITTKYFVESGFDITCCTEHDQKLMATFR